MIQKSIRLLTIILTYKCSQEFSRNSQKKSFQASCAENSTNAICKASTVCNNLFTNIAGLNLAWQPFNQKPIQAAQEKPRFFYAGFYCRWDGFGYSIRNHEDNIKLNCSPSKTKILNARDETITCVWNCIEFNSSF